MNLKRIIPILLLKDDGLVKTINFTNSKYMGPINAVKIFSEKEADEIILDITASLNDKINFDLYQRYLVNVLLQS